MSVKTYAKNMSKYAREENKKNERESRLRMMYSLNVNPSHIGAAMGKKGVN